MLNEAALRMVWLYFSNLPDVVAEVRFDTGKLLERFTALERADRAEGGEEDMDVDNTDVDNTQRRGPDYFWKLRLLHVLRLLAADPHFSWSVKSGVCPCIF